MTGNRNIIRSRTRQLSLSTRRTIPYSLFSTSAIRINNVHWNAIVIACITQWHWSYTILYITIPILISSKLPSAVCPSCLHTTWASLLVKKWLHILPQVPSTQTSTRPTVSEYESYGISFMLPPVQSIIQKNYFS